MGWVSNGAAAGVAGRQIEAIRIRLDGAVANNYELEFNVHAAGIGWVCFTKN